MIESSVISNFFEVFFSIKRFRRYYFIEVKLCCLVSSVKYFFNAFVFR